MNDTPITSTKNTNENNIINNETFPHVLFFQTSSNLSNPEYSNSNSTSTDSKFSEPDDELKNLLPHDLIKSLDINEKNFVNENKNNNDFLRNTINHFPKQKKNILKEDDLISNDNTMTNCDSRFNSSMYSNKTENNMQNYQNINQLMLDTPINSYMKRNNSSMVLMPNNIIMPSAFYSPASNIMLPNINNNLLNYKLNNQCTTENINQYFKNNKNINKNNNINNRKYSFTENNSQYYFDNNNLNPLNFLHYSAGFEKNSSNNNNNNNNNNVNEPSTKPKKNKKKKKSKEEEEYLTEMFGRRGWICEQCNNFNYETRNKCNRCQVPKKPVKLKILIENGGEKKLIDNIIYINHKDDWSCPNCNNVNYAFRLVCNRCQKSKEELEQDGLFEKN